MHAPHSRDEKAVASMVERRELQCMINAADEARDAMLRTIWSERAGLEILM